MATAKQLHDLTDCTICTEVYTDPRVLPCGHTYCLKCIEALSKDKPPGDEVACPLCRKEFIVPDDGVADLPKNFFVANFLQIKELSSVESKTGPCEACSAGEDRESEVVNVASVYCVECQMKLCRICERAHKTIRFSRSHKLIAIGDEIDVETLCQSMPPTFCDQHKDESLKLYCFDCTSAICIMCYIKSHNGHKCSDLNEVVDEFRKQMSSAVDYIATGVEKCRDMLQSVENEKSDFFEQVTKASVEISEIAEQLKQMIDVHKEKLMNELSAIKQKRIKEIESLREEIERQLLSMESYRTYVDEVRQKGTACDIARAASGLHDRADELLMFDITEHTLAHLGHAEVSFTSSDFVIDDVNKTIGQLRLNSVKEGKTIYFKN